MNIILFIIFLMIITSLIYSAAILQQIKNLKFKVDVYFFYFLGWLLYGAYPVLFCLISEACEFYSIFKFSVQLLYAVLFWVLGTSIAIKVNFHNKSYDRYRAHQKRKYIMILAVFTVIQLAEIYMSSLYTNFFEYLQNNYGNYNKQGLNSLTSSIPFFITGVLIFVHMNGFRKMASIFLLIFFIVFMFGGNRNIAIFNLISFIFLHFRGKYVSIFSVILGSILAISIASLIAVSREIGVAAVLGDPQKFDFFEKWIRNLSRYTNSEFGVMYRHVKYLEVAPNFETNVLYSYLISPMINLIPTAVWPSRPYTNSVEFTWYFWRGQETSKSGLGFSPITEAILSAGYFFPIIFCVFGFSIGTLIKSVNSNEVYKPHYFLLLTCVAAASLNFFRIDFAIFTKFIFLTFISGYTFILLCKFKIR